MLGKVPRDPVLENTQRSNWCWEKYPEIQLVLGKVPGDPTGAGKSTERSSTGKVIRHPPAGTYPEIQLVLGKVPRDPVLESTWRSSWCKEKYPLSRFNWYWEKYCWEKHYTGSYRVNLLRLLEVENYSKMPPKARI